MRIGAGGGYVNDGLTFAHELGHLYDRRHVNVPGDVNNDPNYPKYGGDPQSIGEVGVDTRTTPPRLYDPSTSDDLMSYGSNQWISPYTYRNILDARGSHTASPGHHGDCGGSWCSTSGSTASRSRRTRTGRG